MKKIIGAFLGLWMSGGLVGCGSRTADLSDYVREVYTPVYASEFEIVGSSTGQSTLLKVKNPWQGAAQTETMLFIARGGEKAPAGFDGQVVEAGARRIVCMSSSYVALLDALGEVGRVVGVSGKEYIANPSVASAVDVGFEGSLDYERLVALDADLVLLFGVTAPSGLEPKLRELGIPYAYIGEYLEQSPLGKAEWMVAVAEIIDERTRGEELFAPIPLRYKALKELASQAAERPCAMVNLPYGGNWFMPSTHSNQVQLLRDAGGDLVYRETVGNASASIDLELAYRLASEADFWLNTDTANSLAELRRQAPKFADVPAVREGRVYNNTRRTTPAGGNDYWESGVVKPDVILRDLIAIFHPELLPDEELYFYRRLE